MAVGHPQGAPALPPERGLVHFPLMRLLTTPLSLLPSACGARGPLASLAAMLALLAGCASSPAEPAQSAGPPLTQWQTPAQASPPDAAALAQWWRQFQAPMLEGMVEQALAHNTDLRTARASLAQAQAARAVADAATQPQLGLGLSASRTRVDGGGSTPVDKLAFSASWEPDLRGSLGLASQAAQSDEDAAAADLASTRVSLVAEVGLAYVQWCDAQARERLTRASLASLEETQALVRWRAQAGLASALDLEQAVLNTEQTRASLPSLATELAQDAHTLALLLGQTPFDFATRWGASAPAMPHADAAWQGLTVGLPADLLRRRPDLRSAEAAVQAAWLRREQVRREGWPGLSLSGSLGVQALTLAGLGQPGAAVATLAASVDWSLLDGGQRHALVAQQDALWTARRSAYDAAVLGAVKDVEDSLVALRGSQQRGAALSLASQAARASAQLDHLRHAAGLLDASTLLEAQRTELSAALALQSNRSDESLHLIRVFKALGGGWPVEAEPATRAAPAHAH